MHFHELSPFEKDEIEVLKESGVKQSAISLEELEIDCEGEKDLEELLEIMLKDCLEYTISIAHFKRVLIETGGVIDEKRQSIEAVRTSSHEALMSSVNAFSRALAKHYRDNSWVEDFNGERTKYARFAITLTLSRI